MSSLSFSSAVSSGSSSSRSRVTEGYALVKGVLSADTVILLGSSSSSSGPSTSSEKLFSLIGLNTPKCSRSKNAADDAGGFQAKEFLRRQVIGQRVFFRVVYTSEGGREYGTLQLDSSKRDVAELLVESGWATVKAGDKVRPEQEKIMQLQEQAKQSKLGLHGAIATRKVQWAPDDAFALFESCKGRPLPAIVEAVRDGSTVRVEIVPPSVKSLKGVQHSASASVLDSVMLTVYMAGVQSPRLVFPDKESGKESEESEPFAAEAQNFTETRLLSRDVTVTLLGIDKTGNLFGSVQFSKGNITAKLIESGLAKFVPWSAALLKDSEVLKVAEAQAKAAEIKIWSKSGQQAGSSSGALKSEFQTRVVLCLSGDSFMIQDPNDASKEIRVSLASLKCPRIGRRGESHEPLAIEAREFARSRLIGHKVRVLLEYSRALPADPADAPLRQFVSIFIGKQNLSELMLAAGLASLIKHRIDEDRSQFYDALVQAEKSAEAANAGIHAKNLKASKLIDLTERPKADRKDKEKEGNKANDASKSKVLSAKSKQFLSMFQRDSNVQGVIEYCFSATRFKVFIPKESVILAFALAGVKIPQANDKANFPLDALNWIKARALQHTARFEFSTLDKGDNFIGSVFLGKFNLALELVREGLAQTFHFSASKLDFAQEIFQAEREAKEAKKGLWQFWTEPEPTAAEDASSQQGGRRDPSKLYAVRVTEIESANEFFVQYLDDPNIAALESQLAEEAKTIDESETAGIIVGELYAGRFVDNDSEWYRIRIDSETEEGEYRVFYLDYGNYDVLRADQIKPLPASLAKFAGLAHRATLSGVRAPSSEDYREPSALAFNDLVWGAALKARVDYEDWNGVAHLTLIRDKDDDEKGQEDDKDAAMSVNAELVRTGWVRVSKRLPGKAAERLEDLKAMQKFAIAQHFNIWEYGEIDSEDEDDSRIPRGARGKR